MISSNCGAKARYSLPAKARGIARRTVRGLGLLALAQIEFVRFVAGSASSRSPFRRREFRPSPPRRAPFSAPPRIRLPDRLRFRPPDPIALVVGAVFVLALLVGVALLGHVKVGEDFPRQFRESLLVLERLGQAVRDRRRRAIRSSRARGRPDVRPPGAEARRSGFHAPSSASASSIGASARWRISA